MGLGEVVEGEAARREAAGEVYLQGTVDPHLEAVDVVDDLEGVGGLVGPAGGAQGGGAADLGHGGAAGQVLVAPDLPPQRLPGDAGDGQAGLTPDQGAVEPLDRLHVLAPVDQEEVGGGGGGVARVEAEGEAEEVVVGGGGDVQIEGDPVVVGRVAGGEESGGAVGGLGDGGGAGAQDPVTRLGGGAAVAGIGLGAPCGQVLGRRRRGGKGEQESREDGGRPRRGSISSHCHSLAPHGAISRWAQATTESDGGKGWESSSSRPAGAIMSAWQCSSAKCSIATIRPPCRPRCTWRERASASTRARPSWESGSCTRCRSKSGTRRRSSSGPTRRS